MICDCDAECCQPPLVLTAQRTTAAVAPPAPSGKSAEVRRGVRTVLPDAKAAADCERASEAMTSAAVTTPGLALAVATLGDEAQTLGEAATTGT